MHRILVLVAAAALMLGLAAPAALAAEPTSSNRSVVASIAHDVTIPAGDHVDVLFVVRGHADIAGSVDSIVVIDGTATLTGATANSLVVMNGTADLAAGTRVTGDVRTLDATVTRAADAVVGGSVGTFERNAAALAVLLIPLFLLLFIGLGVAAHGRRAVRRGVRGPPGPPRRVADLPRARHGAGRGPRRLGRAADPRRPGDDHDRRRPARPRRAVPGPAGDGVPRLDRGRDLGRGLDPGPLARLRRVEPALRSPP